MTFYKSPSGHFTNFLNQLDLILEKIYSKKYIIICGDVNVNYLVDNNRNTETGLQVSADKTKYMVMSRDQNAGRIHSVRIDNSTFERVE